MAIKLYDKATGLEVRAGDTVTTFRGDAVKLTGYATDGHNRVYVKAGSAQTREFFPSVINCELREDKS